MRELITKKLKIPETIQKDIKIEHAHSAGSASKKDEPRSVVVKFTHFKDRDLVLQKAREINSKGLFVNEEFSTRVVEKRKEELPRMKEERAKGKIAYLS